MVTLIQREFIVDRSLPQAWEHLSRIEAWPSWARHIRMIELRPPGLLGPASTGVIHLAGGMTSAFQVAEFSPPGNWKWAGPILWMTIHYDHQFVALDADRTKLTWIVAAEGIGASTIGRLFALFYRRNMERAIARLIDEMHALPNCRPLTPDDRRLVKHASP